MEIKGLLTSCVLAFHLVIHPTHMKVLNTLRVLVSMFTLIHCFIGPRSKMHFLFPSLSCNLSDVLFMYVQMSKHPKYSVRSCDDHVRHHVMSYVSQEAQLKVKDLKSGYASQLKVSDRQ